ncbi:MAG TPA: GHMP kinase [Anaerolineae bacterium]|nr:GHMP kinase [Anaerolineae bacterium]
MNGIGSSAGGPYQRPQSPISVAEEKEADFQGQGRVAVPGACGELVQGTLDGEQPFLISCPIDRFSVAEVELTSERRGWSCPPDTPKSVTALQAMLARLGHTEMGGQLRIRSDLPRAKGMASSTADIAATVYALAEALGEGVEPWEVARIALSVEPSDSLMFPGLALFDHRSGQVYEDLGPAPPLEVVVLDFGGTVDTLAYNRRYRADLLRKMVAEHREALAAVKEGLRRGNLADVGYGATLSARAHQRILPKPRLETVIGLAREMGALGVNVAHSGTVIGLLLDPGHADGPAMATYLAAHLPGLESISLNRMVGGGPRVAVREQHQGPLKLR